jgi:hypothetical protein
MSRIFSRLAWLWYFYYPKYSGMVRFYWAIVVAATLTIIAVVAFSKDKKEVASVSQSANTAKVEQPADLSANLKP